MGVEREVSRGTAPMAPADPADAEGEGRVRQVAEYLREFIWLTNPEFTRHYYVNAAYERIWGRSRASLYANARSLLDGVHPDDRQRVSDALLGLPHGEYDIEFRVLRPDGEMRWVWSRGFPVHDEHGAVVRVAGISEDITTRKVAEMERERVTESRTRLIRGFTHDVKNPLGAADGFLALLADGIQGELAGPQKESIERARRSIRSALDLIGQMLELARAEAGQLELRCSAVDVRPLLSQIIEEWRAQAEAKGLLLTEEPSSERPTIASDPARISQVLANLVSNAVKYTPRGGRITVSADVRRRGEGTAEHAWVVIDVADTGKGITPGQQSLLFQEFTRFDPHAAHGAGIGLAISRRIAEALGGTISVESEVGAGSTFSLWLPVRRVAGEARQHE